MNFEKRDTLFIGRPSNALPPISLPEKFAISGQEFLIDGNRYDQGEDVLFMVLLSNKGEQVRGYLLANSKTAIQQTARRIPHYGRYSYLVFRAGKNLVKATWRTESSPLKHDFKQDQKH